MLSRMRQPFFAGFHALNFDSRELMKPIGTNLHIQHRQTVVFVFLFCTNVFLLCIFRFAYFALVFFYFCIFWVARFGTVFALQFVLQP